jgi:hypothetical protein
VSPWFQHYTTRFYALARASMPSVLHGAPTSRRSERATTTHNLATAEFSARGTHRDAMNRSHSRIVA